MMRPETSSILARAALLVAALATVSCNDVVEVPAPATVRVDAEASVREATRKVHVRILGGSSVASYDATPALDTTYDVSAWPLDLAIAPTGGDRDRVYQVTVEGLDDQGARTGFGRVISGYLTSRTVLSTIFLDAACRAAMPACDENQTCRDGACVTAVVVPSTLPVVCPQGQAELDGRCVDRAACGTTITCGSNASCATQLEGFLCKCDAGFVREDEACVPDGTVAPSFELGIANALARVPYGADGEVELVLERVGGFTDAIDVAAVTPPAGLTVESISVPAGATNARVRVSASGALVLGTTFTLKMRATSGALVRDASVNAVVTGAPASADATFGTGGTATWSIGGKYASGTLYDVRELDGKLLVAGKTYQGGPTGTNFYVARLRANGTLDTDFHASGTQPGTFEVNFCGCTTMPTAAKAILRMNTGLYLGVGTGGASGAPNANVAIQRFTALGEPDPTPGGDDGVRFVDVGGTEEVEAATLDATQQVVTTGAKDGLAFVAWSTYSGQLSYSVVLDGLPASRGLSIARDPEGRVVVGGVSNGDAFVARLTSTGTLDPSFDGDGIVQLVRTGVQTGARVDVQPDGKVLATFTTDEAGGNLVVTRLRADGSLDGSFGTGGATQMQTGDPMDTVLLLDGRLVVLATWNQMVRLHADGTPDTTLGPNGWKALPTPGTPTALTVTSDGFLVVVGSALEGVSPATTTVGFATRVWY